MTESLPYVEELRGNTDVSRVGGKAANLGRLIVAGFPVPGGFVITTDAYRASHSSKVNGSPLVLPSIIQEQVQSAYRAMGAGAVAVRSSATAEDMGDASMAGQYETFLNIEGEEALFSAILRCWASLDAPRTRAYLAEHGIDLSQVSMAVVVQKLIPADVAGVLFTANPNANGRGHLEMLLEASWGLGESVVAGRVQPDVLRLENSTGKVLSAVIADKRVQLAAGTHDERPVADELRKQACLSSRDVHRLWELGRRTANYFGAPQDIEWAIAGGELYLIQSRPITTRQQAEAKQQLLEAIRQQLHSETKAGRGPWVLHNLAETLPHPTPLTWSVIHKFMSASGGFGEMYRKAGFEPSPALDRDGFLERIGGAVYMDASRAPEMFFKDFPFAYDIEALKTRPDASQLPPTLPRGSVPDRIRAGRKLRAVDTKLHEIAIKLDRQLRDTLFPEIAAYVAANKPMDLKSLSTNWLVELWQEHEKLVLGSFAPQLLLPSLVSSMAMEDLRAFLEEHFWDEDSAALSQLVSSGGLPNRTLIADAKLHDVGNGTYSMEAWLSEHGHRAAGEFDLAAPRWREQPKTALDMAARLASGEGPMQRHQQTTEKVSSKVEMLRAKLGLKDQRELDRRIDMARRYVMFREDGKDLLMLGYDLLRDLALEAGRRLEIGQDVFYLTRDEMFAAIRVGFAPHQVIESRKTLYQTESKVSLPHVIDSAAIEALGNPDVEPSAPISGGHKAFAVSSGVATGPARVLRSPIAPPNLGKGYVLVCPSTDPSWTPLFVNASALVLECGGALSHGAVVAREMGLPAVVLPDSTHIFQDGDEIRVDGNAGWVGLKSDSANTSTSDSPDAAIPHNLVPPPPGQKERLACSLRNKAALLWSIFLIGFFFLPEKWVHVPTIHAMDIVLWPVVRLLGKPGGVAAIAIVIAIGTLLIQKWFTDNPRLLEAKRRANLLKQKADFLPKGSARQAEANTLAARVQWRTLAAAMVPVALLLGPLIMPFVWFSQRVEPATWNAAPGSSVQIVAMVDGEAAGPIHLHAPQPLDVDSSTPEQVTPPPLRKTLERLLSLYRQGPVDPKVPWELQTSPDLARQATADDLERYLSAGIPAQGMTWLIRPHEGTSGRFPVTIETEKGSATIEVILGDEYPPAANPVAGAKNSVIREVRAVYPRPIHEPVFFRPLAGLSGMEHVPFAARLGNWDIGWMGLYILVYVPVLLLARTFLKVA